MEDRTATRTETRYGCFLPDLTGLARRSSTADLPPPISRARDRIARPRFTLSSLMLDEYTLTRCCRAAKEGSMIVQHVDEACFISTREQNVSPVSQHIDLGRQPVSHSVLSQAALVMNANA